MSNNIVELKQPNVVLARLELARFMCIYFYFAKMYPITRFILSCELDKAACCAITPAYPGIMLATWMVVGLS